MVDWRKYIERRSSNAGVKLFFIGTRVSVEHLLERLDEGWSEDELFAAHPRLLPAHLEAARAWADEGRKMPPARSKDAPASDQEQGEAGS